MITPRTRLLAWAAALGLPLAAAAPFSETIMALAGVVVPVFAVFVMVDAIRSRHLLDGITIQLPEVVRLFKDRAGTLPLCLENRGSHLSSKEKKEEAVPNLVRLGLLFPAELISPQEDIWAALPPGGAACEVPWACTPASRGRFALSRGFIGCVSALGFWDVRSELPLRTEVRVYPNLMAERKHVAALFLRRAGLGVRPRRQVGQGREFEKLREYVAGDSLNEIHWKATAKRHRPISKMFQIERTQEVYVMLDVSRLSARGPAGAGPNFLERYITAALILALAAERQGDNFGLAAFSDSLEVFLRAGRGKQHFNLCREALYTMQPRMVTPDFNMLTVFIRTHLRRRALLVFLTSLDDPVLAERFLRNATLLRRQHLLLVHMPRPAGVRPLFSAPVARSEQIYEHLGGHLLWSQLRELQQGLYHAGVQFSLVDSEVLAPRVVSDYCAVKERQLV